jgi:hypothetical protein
MGRLTRRIFGFFSGEWMLNFFAYTANGGGVVFSRTLWIAFWIYLPAFLVRTSLAPGRVFVFDLRQGLADIAETIPWLGAIIGSAYAALYTRYSSQWTYLAGLYNQISQTKASVPEPSEAQKAVLNAWIAGFIEDAEELHLATKPIFAAAIRHWLLDKNVCEWYVQHTAGGSKRLEALRKALDDRHEVANCAEVKKALKRLKKRDSSTMA